MPKQTIFRVPHQLREVNKKAYEPYVISIGPYHHDKDYLKEMEERKVRSLNWLLQWTNQSVQIYLSEIGDMVEKARDCYSEPVDISKEEFLEMMILDGCFIIQFFMGTLREYPFCNTSLIRTSILHDVALVENQLPFFVLCKLLDIIPRTFFLQLEDSTDPKGWFISQLLKRFEGRMPGLRVDRTYNDDSMKNVKHIGHLLLSNWHPSDKAMDKYREQPTDGKWKFIRSATELREAGIDFKKVETGGNESLFDIKFEKGTLEMPTARIADSTESLYCNLIACEQLDIINTTFLTDYVVLINSLINSGKDVELLCKSGIIDNWLGDDEAVAVMFNRLGDYVDLMPKLFFYAKLFDDVNKHYEKRWNRWKANIRHKYFNTPSALISFLAATLLLLLTVLQTIFTIFFNS
ncbi:hypothetical protein SLEP1_g12284 [Rubroshorea leprosula]|uniref:Uncharacterized protein n=1 Tax=Rubroshorea leprosula TaxID=152421 RepID=A0AAV5IC14_9ROSI|nr:hypothetical protein SLEP1_g12284 [Rubroshorea leprosula]